jgi:excisionase family DNA binding protein
MLTLNKPARAPTLKRSAGAERPLDRLLSMKQAAEVLGVHIATIRRLIEAGKLIAVRVADRKIGIRASSIEAHMAANQLLERPPAGKRLPAGTRTPAGKRGENNRMLTILPAGDDVAGARAGTHEGRRTPRVRAQVQARNQPRPRVERGALVHGAEPARGFFERTAMVQECKHMYGVKKRPRAGHGSVHEFMQTRRMT